MHILVCNMLGETVTSITPGWHSLQYCTTNGISASCIGSIAVAYCQVLGVFEQLQMLQQQAEFSFKAFCTGEVPEQKKTQRMESMDHLLQNDALKPLRLAFSPRLITKYKPAAAAASTTCNPASNNNRLTDKPSPPSLKGAWNPLSLAVDPADDDCNLSELALLMSRCRLRPLLLPSTC